jgi:hypothetical protein
VRDPGPPPRLVVHASPARRVLIALGATAFVVLGGLLALGSGPEIGAVSVVVSTLSTWLVLRRALGFFVVLAGVLGLVTHFGGRPAVGAVVVGLFALSGVLTVRSALSRAPALVVDHTGITDRTSALAAGFVPWSEVTGLSTWSHEGQTVVVVGVADPEAVLARVGPVARRLMRVNTGLCPVTLATTALPLSAGQLVEEMAAFAPTAPPGRAAHR